MWNKLMASGAIALVAAFSVTACGVADEDDIDTAADEEIGTGAAAASAEGQFCGGFAGITCPTGYNCVDDPSDTCDPRNGGADCGGICVKNNGNARPGSVERSRGNGRGGEVCGSAVCGRGQYCCNASCSLCVPEGNFCTQQVCDDGGEPCGDSTCGAGEFCCNESCGICAPIGGVCTQQFCD